MSNDDKYLLTIKQREFVKNSLSEYESQASSYIMPKPLNTITIKNRKIMQEFILGSTPLSHGTKATTSLRKRNMRMKILNNQIQEQNISRNHNDIFTKGNLPTINNMYISNKNTTPQYSTSPKTISYIAFNKTTNTNKHMQHTSPITFHSLKHKQKYISLNTRNTVSHTYNVITKPPCDKHCFTEPYIFHRKQKPYVNLREKLKNPKLIQLQKLYEQQQRNIKKHSPTILLGNNITDIYEINSKHPPPHLHVDSFISRTYENPPHKTSSTSFILSDIFNYKGFCIYGICEGCITNPKSPLISSIARECISSHLTDPMSYHLRACHSIKDVLHVLMENDYSVIRNAFASVRDELIQVNIRDDVKDVLNVMMVILVDEEMIACAFGKYVKGYWFAYDDEDDKEELTSHRLVKNYGEEVYIEKVRYSEKMRFVLLGSGLFWENVEVCNVMKIINGKWRNVNEIVDRLYEYKGVIVKKYGGGDCKGTHWRDSGCIVNVDKCLLYSLILLKF